MFYKKKNKNNLITQVWKYWPTTKSSYNVDVYFWISYQYFYHTINIHHGYLLIIKLFGCLLINVKIWDGCFWNAKFYTVGD